MADRTVHLRRGRGGFSFAEVLFAVIILGIGFILVAAIFPVAISQTQTTVDESAAANAARQAANVVSAIPVTITNPVYDPAYTPAAGTAPNSKSVRQLSLFPPTVKRYLNLTAGNTPGAGVVPPPAIVVPITGRALEAIRGNLVNQTDPRFAYVPLYRRENGSPVAQLIVVAIAARNRPVFDLATDAIPPTPTNPVTANLANSTNGSPSGTNYVIAPATVSAGGQAWLQEGCALTASTGTGGSGRSYRLGRQVSAGTYTLDAGEDLSVGPGPDGLWGTADDVFDFQFNAAAVQPSATVQPVPGYARIFANAASVAGRITLSVDQPTAVKAEASVTSGSTANVAPAAAVQGAFVIVADDFPYDAGSPSNASYTLPANGGGVTVGALNGRIYRLGPAILADPTAVPPVAPGTFDLDPQYATAPSLTTGVIAPITGNGGPRARVFLVGAGRAAAMNPSGTNTDTATLTAYTGTAQDTGVFTTLFPAQ